MIRWRCLKHWKGPTRRRRIRHRHRPRSGENDREVLIVTGREDGEVVVMSVVVDDPDHGRADEVRELVDDRHDDLVRRQVVEAPEEVDRVLPERAVPLSSEVVSARPRHGDRLLRPPRRGRVVLEDRLPPAASGPREALDHPVVDLEEPPGRPSRRELLRDQEVLLEESR